MSSLTLSPTTTNADIRKMAHTCEQHGWRATRRYAGMVRAVAAGVPAKFITGLAEIVALGKVDEFFKHVAECVDAGEHFDSPADTLAALTASPGEVKAIGAMLADAAARDKSEKEEAALQAARVAAYVPRR